MHIERSLVRGSFVLFMLALFVGMLIPFFPIPRLGLSQHLTVLMNACVLITLAVAWPRLADARHSTAIRRLFLFCAFTMSIGGIFGAAWGTHKFTPMASAGGPKAELWQEIAIGILINVTVLVYIVASSMAVWALRPRHQE